MSRIPRPRSRPVGAPSPRSANPALPCFGPRRSAPPSPCRPRPTAADAGGNAGFTLIDLLLTLFILAIVALISVPPLLRSTADLRLRLAASEASRIFAQARSYSMRHNSLVAVKFHPPEASRGHAPGKGGPPGGTPGKTPGRTTWTLHRDGDGDGVRSRDVERGIDPVVPAPGAGMHREARFAQGIVPGFPPGPLPRDPSGRQLTRRHDPIRFNRSDLASFGPLGTATPGSLYLTDGRGLAVVRITGRTGRVRVMTYDAKEGAWR